MQSSIEKYKFGNLTDVGMVRSENQDYYGRYSGAYGELIIVCDGMGGHAGGSIASRIAVDTIARHFADLDSEYDPDSELRRAFDSGQSALLDQVTENPELTGMGTTVVILLIKDGQYWCAHCGDSRLYLKRRGQLLQLTRDHSFVQNLVDMGAITEEEAESHTKRNQIMRALGSEKYKPDIAGPYPVYKRDVFMLCSDGLYHYFTRTEISDYLEQEPQQACIAMVEKAKQRGGDDNITLQIVQINTGKTAPVTRIDRNNNLAWVVTICLSVLIVFVPLILKVRSELKRSNERLKTNETNPGQDAKDDSPGDKQGKEDMDEQTGGSYADTQNQNPVTQSQTPVVRHKQSPKVRQYTPEGTTPDPSKPPEPPKEETRGEANKPTQRDSSDATPLDRQNKTSESGQNPQ